MSLPYYGRDIKIILSQVIGLDITPANYLIIKSSYCILLLVEFTRATGSLACSISVLIISFIVLNFSLNALRNQLGLSKKAMHMFASLNGIWLGSYLH